MKSFAIDDWHPNIKNMSQCVIYFFLPPEFSGCERCQRCPADWREINSRCYFLSTDSRTWENSRKYCQSKGADLVVINSEQEQVESTIVCIYLSFLMFMDSFLMSYFTVISINRGPCTVLMVMLISCSGLVCMTQLETSSGSMDLLWPNCKDLRITLNYYASLI